MTPDIPLGAIADMVALQLGRASVRPDDRLYADLAAESMDLVHLALAIEDRYGVALPDDDLADLATVRDVHALACRHAAAGS